MTGLVLLADAKRDPLREPEVILGTAGIAVALLVGAFAIWLVDRWRKQAATPHDAAEELTDFRGMFQRGEITEDEYAKLRSKVAKRVQEATAKANEGIVDLATGEIVSPGRTTPPQPPPDPNGDGSRSPPI